MTPRIQRIQAAISQAKIQGQEQSSPTAAGQSLVCSFDIAGRSQVGYLGVNSIAEVTPPWFPKDAFQVRGRREKTVSPMITLKTAQSKVSQGGGAGASFPVAEETSSGGDRESSVAIQHSATQPLLTSPIPSSVSVDIFQTVAHPEHEFIQEELPLGLAGIQTVPEEEAIESSPVTAEILADLFEQAESLPASAAVADNEIASTPSSSSQSASSEFNDDPRLSKSSILAPVSAAEQAAAQALAQSLCPSQRLHQENAVEALPHPEPDSIKPIATVAPPALPRSKSPAISSHHNTTNPMLPLELLQNIGQEVILWQEALQEVHQKIQVLYQEGPMSDGWLEKHSDAGVYLLCGLDSTGQSWRRPCHPDELQQVGLAIGRYKKLRLLLGEKQRLDQRIKRLSETLTMLRLRLRAY